MRGADGQWEYDVLTTSTDEQKGEALLQPIMRDGKLVNPLPSLMDSRNHTAEQLAQLPPALKRLEPAGPYEVRISEALGELTVHVDKGESAL